MPIYESLTIGQSGLVILGIIISIVIFKLIEIYQTRSIAAKNTKALEKYAKKYKQYGNFED